MEQKPAHIILDWDFDNFDGPTPEGSLFLYDVPQDVAMVEVEGHTAPGQIIEKALYRRVPNTAFEFAPVPPVKIGIAVEGRAPEEIEHEIERVREEWHKLGWQDGKVELPDFWLRSEAPPLPAKTEPTHCPKCGKELGPPERGCVVVPDHAGEWKAFCHRPDFTPDSTDNPNGPLPIGLDT